MLSARAVAYLNVDMAVDGKFQLNRRGFSSLFDFYSTSISYLRSHVVSTKINNQYSIVKFWARIVLLLEVNSVTKFVSVASKETTLSEQSQHLSSTGFWPKEQ